MIAGGSEAAITPMGVGGFAALRALSTRNDEPEQASGPFDKDRDGFIIGEGVGRRSILEELERRAARGARIYAELVGYGMSGDAYHITAPSEDGDGAVRVMRAALEDAGRRARGRRLHQRATAPRRRMGDRDRDDRDQAVFGEHAREAGGLLDQVDDRAPARAPPAASRPASPRWPSATRSCRRRSTSRTRTRSATSTTCRTRRARRERALRAVELVRLRRHQRGAAVQRFEADRRSSLTAEARASARSTHEDHRLREAGAGHRDADQDRPRRQRRSRRPTSNWIVSPYDEFAIEEALRLKEAKGGEVVLVTLGPDRAQSALRSGLAMGADSRGAPEGPALRRRPTRSARPRALAAAIKAAGAVRPRPRRASRAWAATTARSRACWPSCSTCPQVTMAVKIEVAGRQGRRSSARSKAARETWETTLPAVISAQKGLNEPRYASLKGIMAAKKKPIEAQGRGRPRASTPRRSRRRRRSSPWSCRRRGRRCG